MNVVEEDAAERPAPSPENSSSDGQTEQTSNSSTLSSASTPPRGSGKKRMHVKLACDHCNRSHLACDVGRPCKNCARHGVPCIDAPDRKKRGRKRKVLDKFELCARGFPGHYAAAHGRDSSRYMHASPRSNGHLSNPHDNSFNVPFPGGGLCTGRNELFLPNRNAPSNAADYTSGNMSSSSGSSSNMCSVLAFSGSKRHTTTAAATRPQMTQCSGIQPSEADSSLLKTRHEGMQSAPKILRIDQLLSRTADAADMALERQTSAENQSRPWLGRQNFPSENDLTTNLKPNRELLPISAFLGTLTKPTDLCSGDTDRSTAQAQVHQWLRNGFNVDNNAVT